MTVKIIAENILSNADFISATDQAGGHIGQPIPDSGNTGAFNLFASGNIADTVYSGTATGDGAVGKTTVVDSLLAAYGDDYFIGATIAITSGACSGETATVTDFAQATGTITFAALTAQVVTGVTFTLTIPYATRDFRVELVAGGDPGTATFKWSHNGGATYLGRDNPDQATWPMQKTIVSAELDTTYTNQAMIFKAGGKLLAVHMNYIDSDHGSILFSDDNGITWGDEVKIADTAGSDPTDIACGLPLSTGRILLFDGEDYKTYYSDDNGLTWALFSTLQYAFYDVRETADGVLIAAVRDNYSTASAVKFTSSIDGGITWTTPSTVSDATNTQDRPTLCKNAKGQIIYAYSTDEDTLYAFDVKCKISSDNGATWGAAIDILDYYADGGTDHFMLYPWLELDLNGDVYCTASDATAAAGSDVVLSKSSDHGLTWGAAKIISAGSGTDYNNSYLKLIGNEMFCVFQDTDNAHMITVRRGFFEAFSANGCPTPVDGSATLLTNDVSITFLGGAGIAADKWQFEAQYSYGMENIISHSPSKPYRATTDNFENNIVLDLGQYERFRATGVAFFGCNLRTLSFQMNASDSWGTPSVDESIVFDVGTGTVDAVAGNMVQDTAFLADYPDHHFSSKGKAEKYYLRATAGIDDGVTWGILDNVDGFFILDITTAISIVATDTFAIYQSYVSKTFTGGNYRYIRISIPAQETAEGYYQIGSMLAGQATALDKGWSRGYGKDIEFNIDLLRTPTGGFNPVKMSNRSRVFTLSWPANETARGQLSATAEYLEGKNLALIPDHTDLKDCYLVKLDGSISQRHRYLNRFDTGLRFIEVL